MGLDLMFPRNKAINAGLELKLIQNSETYSADDDPEYISWCQHMSECVKVPNTDHYVTNDASVKAYIMVRANQWGRTYAPLTAWLKQHDIEWEES